MASSELQMIREIGDIIASGEEYHTCLRGIAALVAEYVGGEVCNILVYDETAHELILEATYGFGQESVHHIHVPTDAGIVGNCFRNVEVINLARKQDHPDFRLFDAQQAEQFSALLAVPLVAGGHPIGVVGLERRLKRAFSARAVDMAQALASPLAVFIRNAGLRETLDQQDGRKPKPSKAGLSLHGLPITQGTVRGRAYFPVAGSEIENVPMEHCGNVKTELRLFHRALEVAREDTLELQKEASRILAEADAAIFYAHLFLLEDPSLISRVEDAITREKVTLRFALKMAYQEIEKELSALKSDRVRERLDDFKDVTTRLYQAADELAGVSRRPKASHSVRGTRRPIVVVRELLPSQLIRLPLAELAGIVCEEGGTTSHVAILAKTLQIPMLVGVKGATTRIRRNDHLLLDCIGGYCHVNPPPRVVATFRDALKMHAMPQVAPATKCDLTATKDGTVIELAGNISLVNEMRVLAQHAVRGIGLYRTEFMFMIRNTYPSEEEQYQIFRQVVSQPDAGFVNIRLLDVGGDKPLPYVNFGNEENPALGWRGLRFLLGNPHFLDPHLRAILRTTMDGQTNILLPMVSDLDELMAAKEAIAKAESQLEASGVPFRRDYKLGVMVEVPSILWALPQMLDEIDFVSVGTNDLIQYLFAVDRTNSRVKGSFRQFHPIVMEVIGDLVEIVSASPGTTLSICGEVAGNALGVPLLLGAGIRSLSMNPWQIPGVCDVLDKVTIEECKALYLAAAACRHDEEVVSAMQAFADEHGLASPTTPRGK